VRTSFLLFPVIISCVLLLINSCAHVTLEPDAESVEILYSHTEQESCEYLGDVIGSDGNLMTYLFISNRNLTRGALNDIRNRARAIGGDTVYIIREHMGYTTSTTFLGSVYNCRNTPVQGPQVHVQTGF
jgi:hypothetical protein